MGTTFESEWAGSEGKSRRLLRRRRVIDCRRGKTNFPVMQINSSQDQFNPLAECYSQSPAHRAGASLPVLLELAEPKVSALHGLVPSASKPWLLGRRQCDNKVVEACIVKRAPDDAWRFP
jgi:hypothetical protein